MKSIKKTILCLLIALTIPSIVYAHLIGGSGFSSGAFHPLSGIDHLLAMIAVGIISIRYGGKAIWLIPLTFIISMVIGGIMGILGIQISFIEIGIALSVIFLGIAIFLQNRFSLYITIIFVGLSAIFHGHAHGSEVPLIFSPVYYVVGFVLSTTLLHISGVIIGHYATKRELATKLLRYAGAGMGVAGLVFLFSA